MPAWAWIDGRVKVWNTGHTINHYKHKYEGSFIPSISLYNLQDRNISNNKGYGNMCWVQTVVHSNHMKLTLITKHTQKRKSWYSHTYASAIFRGDIFHGKYLFTSDRNPDTFLSGFISSILETKLDQSTVCKAFKFGNRYLVRKLWNCFILRAERMSVWKGNQLKKE